MPGSDKANVEDVDKKIAEYKEQLRKLEQLSLTTASDGICEIEEMAQQAKRKIRRIEKV